MRKILETLRLHHETSLSCRKIGQSLSVSASVVIGTLSAFKASKLSWPLPEALSEEDIKSILFPKRSQPKANLSRVEPDFAYLHQELKKKGVTLQLLWEEYQAIHAENAYSRTQFYHHYKKWRGQLKLSMRQTHVAGDKLFIDYCGQTVSITDVSTGEVRQAQIFVGVLGASNYTFAEATWSQSLPDWIGSHVRMFSYFGGIPSLLVPDNLKSGVNKACRYEPDTNQTYAEMVAHYHTAVLPARPRKPKDKAKVEAGVLLVERWILARLRGRKFFSLAELNIAIKELLEFLNHKPFKKLPGSRRTQFEQLDKPALRPLPAKPYAYAEFKKVRLHVDYHVEINGHYYSAPYQLIKKQLEARISENTIELFYQGKRVASHQKKYSHGRHTTTPEHMPTRHRKHLEWHPEKFLTWAKTIGAYTEKLTQHLLENKAHPEQGYRACLGLLNLKGV